jgi:heme-degrading monooxygenase HmoA
MIAKVIIKRKVAQDKEKELFTILRDLRSVAMEQEGYISGETLVCAEQTNKILVISKWASMEHWNEWKNNADRRQIDYKLGELQEEPTIYEPYVFTRYKVAAEMGFPLPLQDQQL